MINDIIYGDITDSKLNPGDIIIGMNSRMAEVSAIGRPFLANVTLRQQVELGSVVSFQFGRARQLHMLICHHLGTGGWLNAEKYIRYCLDYLWQQHGQRKYAIVQIGKGPIGRRDEADVPAIRTAMTTSFLEMDLFIIPEREEARVAVAKAPLKPFRMWDMNHGERRIHVN